MLKINNLNSINSIRYYSVTVTNNITFFRYGGRRAKRSGGLASLVFITVIFWCSIIMLLSISLRPILNWHLKIPPIFYEVKVSFPHTLVESKFFLPLVFKKMLLSAKVMRKCTILTSKTNKECQVPSSNLIC